MFSFKINKVVIAIILMFFAVYMLWLHRAYYDVAYMDTIQILAGNINNMYNNDVSLHDFYYRSPFLLFFSTLLTYINCKLFAYNSFYENVVSGIFLFLIAVYFIKTHLTYFSKRLKLVFSFLASLIIFSLIKWEMSLWGGGFSHYIVVFLGFVCVNMAHNYYLKSNQGKILNRYFLPVYFVLSIVSILETTSYFLPFLASLLLLLFINYKVFKEKVDIKKWRIVLGSTILLIIFSIVINYMAEVYAVKNPYEVYGKVNVSQSMGSSFSKIVHEPGFVLKFFLVANAGILIDKDSYKDGAFTREAMPFVGFILLLLYVYAIYLFIKKRKIEGTMAVNLMMYTVILYGTILIARMGFDDVYYGGSSRYTAASFSGALGLTTFFLLLLDQKNKQGGLHKVLYYIPIALVTVCTLIVYKNQWQIAPYRKESYLKMADNLRSNTNLESLQAYNNDIAQKARQMMIRHKLNVFKPETRAENYKLNSNLLGIRSSGFYNEELSDNSTYRWTNGEGVIYLPNLYTIGDTVRVRLNCYVPIEDTPVVILNDNLLPYLTRQVDGGYEYTFAFQEQKVFYKVLIKNRSYSPKEMNGSSQDLRRLGLIFHSMSFDN